VRGEREEAWHKKTAETYRSLTKIAKMVADDVCIQTPVSSTSPQYSYFLYLDRIGYVLFEFVIVEGRQF
tara:strand:+ start:323 stop:529 length:207 start_codon:yes stop_codon:yes gene_type:complete